MMEWMSRILVGKMAGRFMIWVTWDLFEKFWYCWIISSSSVRRKVPRLRNKYKWSIEDFLIFGTMLTQCWGLMSLTS
jgi:hypothetical protein